MDSLAAYLRSLQKLLRRRGETSDRAEDLVQEAYLRMQVYCKEGHEVRRPEAFLLRTVLNLAVDVRRREHRDRYETDTVEELHLPDLAPTPDEVFAAEQRLIRTRNTLDRVSRRTRQVFFMHRLQGYSYVEIAKRLGISVSSVEKHIASAVTVLAIEGNENES